MASGWNLWVWLECIGVVSGCYCEEVHRFPHIITYPYSTCITVALFFAAGSLLCSFLKCFFVLVYVIFVQYSKGCSKNIQDCSKIEITRTWRYNYIDKNVRRLCVHASPKTSTFEAPRDI